MQPTLRANLVAVWIRFPDNVSHSDKNRKGHAAPCQPSGILMHQSDRSISVSGSEELCQRCDFFFLFFMEFARFQTCSTEPALFLKCDVIAAASGRKSTKLKFSFHSPVVLGKKMAWEGSEAHTADTVPCMFAVISDEAAWHASQKPGDLCQHIAAFILYAGQEFPVLVRSQKDACRVSALKGLCRM